MIYINYLDIIFAVAKSSIENIIQAFRIDIKMPFGPCCYKFGFLILNIPGHLSIASGKRSGRDLPNVFSTNTNLNKGLLFVILLRSLITTAFHLSVLSFSHQVERSEPLFQFINLSVNMNELQQLTICKILQSVIMDEIFGTFKQDIVGKQHGSLKGRPITSNFATN